MLMEDETEVDLSRTGTSARASPDHLKHSLPLPDTVFHRSAPARTSSPAPDNAVMAELEVQKVKAEYLARLNGLEDRLAEAMRQKHELQAKLDVASRG